MGQKLDLLYLSILMANFKIQGVLCYERYIASVPGDFFLGVPDLLPVSLLAS